MWSLFRKILSKFSWTSWKDRRREGYEPLCEECRWVEAGADEAVPMTQADTWTSSQMVRYGPSPDGLFFWTGKFSQLKSYFLALL